MLSLPAKSSVEIVLVTAAESLHFLNWKLVNLNTFVLRNYTEFPFDSPRQFQTIPRTLEHSIEYTTITLRLRFHKRATIQELDLIVEAQVQVPRREGLLRSGDVVAKLSVCV